MSVISLGFYTYVHTTCNHEQVHTHMHPTPDYPTQTSPQNSTVWFQLVYVMNALKPFKTTSELWFLVWWRFIWFTMRIWCFFYAYMYVAGIILKWTIMLPTLPPTTTWLQPGDLNLVISLGRSSRVPWWISAANFTQRPSTPWSVTKTHIYPVASKLLKLVINQSDLSINNITICQYNNFRAKR